MMKITTSKFNKWLKAQVKRGVKIYYRFNEFIATDYVAISLDPEVIENVKDLYPAIVGAFGCLEGNWILVNCTEIYAWDNMEDITEYQNMIGKEPNMDIIKQLKISKLRFKDEGIIFDNLQSVGELLLMVAEGVYSKVKGSGTIVVLNNEYPEQVIYEMKQVPKLTEEHLEDESLDFLFNIQHIAKAATNLKSAKVVSKI